MSIPAMLPMRNDPGISIPFLTDSLICSCRVNYPDNGIRPKGELSANGAKSNISQKCPHFALLFSIACRYPLLYRPVLQMIPAATSHMMARKHNGYELGIWSGWLSNTLLKASTTHCDTHR